MNDHYGDESQSASDQDDEMVSETEIDDEDDDDEDDDGDDRDDVLLVDTEAMQFTYTKSSRSKRTVVGGSSSNQHHRNQQPDYDTEINDDADDGDGGGTIESTTADCQCTNNVTVGIEPITSTCILLCLIAMLFLSTFVLLICLPLYVQQLNADGGNADGAGGNDDDATASDYYDGNDLGAAAYDDERTPTYNVYGAMLFICTVITSAFLLVTMAAAWCLKLNIKWHKLPMPLKR